MESKLVYRTLRKISDWTLAFYSEVHVTGHENVPEDGPLIVASSHHNEIIDIATLSVTIPHRRSVCYWAKSSMFRNPITRAILLSSGSIPVKRNPNSVTSTSSEPLAGGSGTTNPSIDVHQSLFRETFQALDASEVIGIFPEGTSYTEPQIAQVKDGASWTALEYARWCKEKEAKKDIKRVGARKLLIVPVAIVYTDKSLFQSRVAVKYGKSIDITEYAQEYLSVEDPDNRRAVRRRLTTKIEERLIEQTVNAPDWDTFWAAKVLRDIAWRGESNIPLKDYVHVSQRFISILVEREETIPDTFEDKKALIKYYALLHYAELRHESLAAVYPNARTPTCIQALSIFLRELVVTFLHPRAILFLPAFLAHIPAYISGTLACKFLANAREEETHAQFKGLFGGLGFGAAAILLGNLIAQKLVSLGLNDRRQSTGSWLGFITEGSASWLFGINDNSAQPSTLRRTVGTFMVIYGTVWILSRWHNLLITGNYRQYHRLLASFKMLIGMLTPTSSTLEPSVLERFSYPPTPPENPYIKRRDAVRPSSKGSAATAGHEKTSGNALGFRPPLGVLVRHLLAARTEAEAVAGKLIKESM